MFVNYSNHPSSKWNKEQIEAASEYGNIIDVPFFQVDPACSSDEVKTIAEKETEKIMSYDPSAVLCVGDFSLTYQIVTNLKEKGIKVLSASSKREVIEEKTDSGENTKKTVFKFEGFREY